MATLNDLKQILKHGSHNQKDHNPHKGKGGDRPAAGFMPSSSKQRKILESASADLRDAIGVMDSEEWDNGIRHGRRIIDQADTVTDAMSKIKRTISDKYSDDYQDGLSKAYTTLDSYYQ